MHIRAAHRYLLSQFLTRTLVDATMNTVAASTIGCVCFAMCFRRYGPASATTCRVLLKIDGIDAFRAYRSDNR